MKRAWAGPKSQNSMLINALVGPENLIYELQTQPHGHEMPYEVPHRQIQINKVWLGLPLKNCSHLLGRHRRVLFIKLSTLTW